MCLTPSKGYWKKDCPETSKVGDKKSSNANVVQEGNEDNLTLTVSLSITHADEWILDSGCSYHMCPNKNLSRPGQIKNLPRKQTTQMRKN